MIQLVAVMMDLLRHRHSHCDQILMPTIMDGNLPLMWVVYSSEGQHLSYVVGIVPAVLDKYSFLLLGFHSVVVVVGLLLGCFRFLNDLVSFGSFYQLI